MHLTILSRRLSIYTTRRLVQAARLRGMKVRVLDPLQVELHLGEHAPVLFYQKRKLSPTDVVIPRIAPSIQGYGLAVVNHFVRLGVPALNGAEAIATSRNKMRALQLLSGEGVPVPRTVMAATASDLKDMVELVGGVDEVGMAPLAGPVVACAVILPRGTRIAGVNDSKQLTAEEREALAPQIRAAAVAVGIGRAEVHEIDSINIYHAGLLALRRAVLALSPLPQHLLVDARKLRDLPFPQQAIIKGDAKSITIGAASIVAKVHRDALMSELDRTHPGYGFAAHKGYPTPVHLSALEALGACPIHRRSFAPVARRLGLDLRAAQGDLFAQVPPPAPPGPVPQA
ncbi:MAG: hypothetical protein NVS4B10_22620 [Myxococcales bacterium]